MPRGSPHQAFQVPVGGRSSMSPRRALEERIFLRYPALNGVFFGFLGRLPRVSRLRRRLLVRLGARACSAANRRDFDVLLLGFDPEFDYRIVSAGPGGFVNPDLVGHHRGHAGYRHVWRTMMEAFPDVTLEPEELYDMGDRLLAVTRVRGHGSGSGVPIDQALFQIFYLRRGLVIRQEDHGNLESALQAVGLDHF